MFEYGAEECEACVRLFTFDLICHADILIHMCAAGATVFTAWHSAAAPPPVAPPRTDIL